MREEVQVDVPRRVRGRERSDCGSQKLDQEADHFKLRMRLRYGTQDLTRQRVVAFSHGQQHSYASKSSGGQLQKQDRSCVPHGRLRGPREQSVLHQILDLMLLCYNSPLHNLADKFVVIS